MRRKEDRVDMVAESEDEVKEDGMNLLLKVSQAKLPQAALLDEMDAENEEMEREASWPLHPIPGFKEDRIEEEKIRPLL